MASEDLASRLAAVEAENEKLGADVAFLYVALSEACAKLGIDVTTPPGQGPGLYVVPGSGALAG